MKIVIDIPEEIYNSIQDNDYCGTSNADMYNAVKSGIPLEEINEKYWDYVNGRVTNDSSYAKIWDSGSLYIETYQVYGDSRFDISYTQDIKDTCNLYEYRESICQQHGIHLNCLGKLLYLGVPTKVYNEIYDIKE